MESEKNSEMVLEEEKELSLAAFDILNSNNDDTFLIKLKENSKIEIIYGQYWDLLLIFPHKFIQKIKQTVNANNLSEEMIDFLIKSKDENSFINYEWDIDFDTKEFKAFAMKIYKLMTLDIPLKINWNDFPTITIMNQVEEEDFVKFIKFILMLSYLSETNSRKKKN